MQRGLCVGGGGAGAATAAGATAPRRRVERGTRELDRPGADAPNDRALAELGDGATSAAGAPTGAVRWGESAAVATDSAGTMSGAAATATRCETTGRLGAIERGAGSAAQPQSMARTTTTHRISTLGSPRGLMVPS